MTKEEMLKTQNAIYANALDKVWEELSKYMQEDLEWIWDEMDNELDKLQNENAGKVLGEIFNKWGEDHNKNN